MMRGAFLSPEKHHKKEWMNVEWMVNKHYLPFCLSRALHEAAKEKATAACRIVALDDVQKDSIKKSSELSEKLFKLGQSWKGSAGCIMAVS